MCARLDEERSHDELVAEIRREFCEGLPGRLETMRLALERLAESYDAGAADKFYRTAHSLKGTAASFEADELVEPAAALTDVGLRWFEGGRLDRGEVLAAFEYLELLVGAVRRYTARLEGNTTG